jgi:hypothetical protein
MRSVILATLFALEVFGAAIVNPNINAAAEPMPTPEVQPMPTPEVQPTPAPANPEVQPTPEPNANAAGLFGFDDGFKKNGFFGDGFFGHHDGFGKWDNDANVAAMTPDEANAAGLFDEDFFDDGFKKGFGHHDGFFGKGNGFFGHNRGFGKWDNDANVAAMTPEEASAAGLFDDDFFDDGFKKGFGGHHGFFGKGNGFFGHHRGFGKWDNDANVAAMTPEEANAAGLFDFDDGFKKDGFFGHHHGFFGNGFKKGFGHHRGFGKWDNDANIAAMTPEEANAAGLFDDDFDDGFKKGFGHHDGFFGKGNGFFGHHRGFGKWDNDANVADITAEEETQ